MITVLGLGLPLANDKCDSAQYIQGKSDQILGDNILFVTETGRGQAKGLRGQLPLVYI